MKVKFGIIGCGHIAKRFAKNLAISKGGELYSAAARDVERAQALIDEFGGNVAYGNYLDLICDENVEIVYISLIHNLHFEVAKLCVEHGKAVICEKPFFLTKSEAVELAELAYTKNILIMEAMWTRCLPAFLKSKEWIKNGKIGEVKLIDAAFCFQFPLTEQTKAHRLYNPKTAGGALLDVGVYPYEFITGILEEKPVEIQAVVQKASTGVDETICMSMLFNSGAIGNAKASIAVNTSDIAYIYGTKAHIKIDRFYAATSCELIGNDGELLQKSTEPCDDGFIYEIEHICELYRAGKTESPLIPISDSIDFAEAADIIRSKCNLG